MVKRLFTLLLALMGLASAWAEVYPVAINGVNVTSDNYTNITAAGGFAAVKSGAGTVTYNPATNTLTLSNAVIEASRTAIEFTSSPSYLVLADGTTNSVTTNGASGNYPAIGANNVDLTIEGGGTGTFTATGKGTYGNYRWGIYNGQTGSALITIRNCTASFVGTTMGIATNGNLLIDNATVTALGGSRSVSCTRAFTLNGVDILQPSGAYHNPTKYAICEAGTENPVTSEVKIGKPELVPNLRYDVSGDGQVTLQDLTMMANVLVGRTNVPVTRLSLSRTWLTIVPGESYQVLPTVEPANADFKTLAWRSSNYGVAQVSQDGTVAGVAPGSCTITATTLDGSNKSRSVEVTVLQPVTSITLSSTSLNIATQSTSQLTATVLPTNAASREVSWTSSDESVATVSNTGLVSALQEGTCTITCRALDGSGVTATCNVTVYWQDRSGTIGGHAYVDLGLPSGTLWAATNVGASSPEGYGNYYAWGETSQKSEYSWNTYFDTSDSGTTFNIYKQGGQTVLQTTHDVAYQNWGSNWCMATWDQWIELVNKCTFSWTTRNGVYGYQFVGKGGNSIFLPAAGYYQTYHTTTLEQAGSSGRYWTSRLANDNDRARSVSFSSTSLQNNAQSYRYFGFSVRPVRKQ